MRKDVKEEALMTSGNGLMLVADDPRLAEIIHLSWKPVLDTRPLFCSFDAVRSHVGPTSQGLLVLAAGDPADAERVRRLVQEISLRKWPPTILIVVTAEAARSEGLAVLDPYVAGRFIWPGGAAALVRRVRDFREDRGSSAAQADESLATRIARRLQAQTPSLASMAQALALAASHDVTVLLTGETGTGKTFLAQMIHEHSPRREHGFLVVPCGALSANLIESELFGHAKGAFTGAERAKVGKFQAAGDGTLLLDEIDALGLDQQANLLRVLETGEFEPVGSNETHTCRARIIAASNWNLEEAVAQGKFRQDLYYRLNVMAFHLPPLRERVQDIAPLVREMAVRFTRKFGKDLFAISPAVSKVLETFAWPGNIRQLENVIQQAVLVSTGPELRLPHMPLAVQEYASPSADRPRIVLGTLTQGCEARERSVIERAIVSSDYSRARAADALGISRVTLYKKMRKYGLLDMPRRPR
jgi:transcriptional regulator with PAS, ATPase and Fis domain